MRGQRKQQRSRSNLPKSLRKLLTMRPRILPVPGAWQSQPESIPVRPTVGITDRHAFEYRWGCVCLSLMPGGPGLIPKDRRQVFHACSRVYRLTRPIEEASLEVARLVAPHPTGCLSVNCAAGSSPT